MKIKAKLELPSINEQMKNCGLDERGRVQKFIDGFVLYQSEPYVPGKHIHDEGVNATANELGSGKVIWNSPDATYLYEKRLMVDPLYKVAAFPIRGGKISFDKDDGEIEGFVSRKGVQKILDPKGRTLEFHGGGKRGGEWFDRMMNDKKDELIKGVENIINGNK